MRFFFFNLLNLINSELIIITIWEETERKILAKKGHTFEICFEVYRVHNISLEVSECTIKQRGRER